MYERHLTSVTVVAFVRGKKTLCFQHCEWSACCLTANACICWSWFLFLLFLFSVSFPSFMPSHMNVKRVPSYVCLTRGKKHVKKLSSKHSLTQQVFFCCAISSSYSLSFFLYLNRTSYTYMNAPHFGLSYLTFNDFCVHRKYVAAATANNNNNSHDGKNPAKNIKFKSCITHQHGASVVAVCSAI